MGTEVQAKRDTAVKTVTCAAMISIFVYSFVMSLTNVLVNEVVEAFSLTGASQGLMSSMLSAGTMLALVITPVMQGHVGKLTVLVFSCALQAAMLLAGGFSPVFLVFCGSYLILGIGSGLVDAYSNSSIVDVQKSNSAKYLGYLHGLFGVGSLIAPVAVYRILLSTGWRGVHYIMAAILAAAALIVFFLSRRGDRRDLTAATSERKLNKADLLEYMGNRRNLLLISAGVFASATQTGLLMWIVRYMTVRFDAAAIGALSVSVYWVCATINRFFVARIRVAPMKLFTFGAGLSSIFLVFGVASENPVVMCVIMGMMGFCCGHFMPVLFSECAAGYEGKTTFTTSVIMFIMSIARIIVPLFTAYIGDYVSEAAGMLLPAAAAFVAACFGISIVRADLKKERD